MSGNSERLDTKLVHAGEIEPRIAGAVSMPIFQSSTYETGDAADYHDLRYIRCNNTPNHTVLHRKLAALENAEAALVASSGMAAITTTLLTYLRADDHVIAQDCLYGGTHDFFTGDLERFGISYTFVDANDPASWAAKLTPNTKVFYCETLTNPTLQMADLKAVSAFAKEHGLVSMIDNTFATPVNFRPAEHGFDLSMHSATKYLNGHTDIVAGVVIGRAEPIEQIRQKLNHLGGALDPHACFLLHRGLKTLAVRIRHQQHTAQMLAEALEANPAVSKVNYPGLPSHPAHERARELLNGFSAMMSFDIGGGVEAAQRFEERVRIPIVAPSLGGPETLVTRPAATSHQGMDPDERRSIGISDGLIRVSVGLEAAEDLIEDFTQALSG